MEKNMKEKRKLVGRNTCTPAYDSQVRSSVTLSLNREETLSEQSLKTPSNNPHADLQSGMTGRDLRVPVINMRNEPLITCVKSIIKKGEEKKMDTDVKNVKLVRYRNVMQFEPQLLPTLTHGVSLGVVI
ncbi:MAG: hypothetical protein ACYCSA_04590 [Thermoplasmataceae archaeon]